MTRKDWIRIAQEELVPIADKLDEAGNFELAAEVDSMIVRIAEATGGMTKEAQSALNWITNPVGTAINKGVDWVGNAATNAVVPPVENLLATVQGGPLGPIRQKIQQADQQLLQYRQYIQTLEQQKADLLNQAAEMLKQNPSLGNAQAAATQAAQYQQVLPQAQNQVANTQIGVPANGVRV